ncbi:MAG: AMP-binding protein [Oscillospiraceae bacterium]|jgi:acyl-CoA synthetase (AMP-forming)/AMP-acid ligase II|nr:AMP-binding protein [Oscillospiraceae bacterium]
MPITDFLERNARDFADEIALVEINPSFTSRQAAQRGWKEAFLVETAKRPSYRKEMTWRQFDELSNCTAQFLLSQGVKRGDKVAILMMNCLEWLPLYFGILKTGALAVPMNFRYSSDEIEYCLKLADVSLLLFGPEFVERIEELKMKNEKLIIDGLTTCDKTDNSSLSILNSSLHYVGDNCPAFAQDFFAGLAGMSCDKPNITLSDEQDGAIYFSSGTTGFPKAILHTHRSLVHACETEQAHHGQTHDDVFLCIPPLYHTGAKMHWFGSLLVGGRGVLLRGVQPDWIIETAAKERATIVWLLVPWCQDILDAIERGDVDLARHDLSPLRLMHIGAQPVPPSLVKRWLSIFPHHDYDTNYGLSESIGPGSVHLGVGNIHKVGAIGKAGYGWQTRIADENGSDVPRGDVGELLVKGDGVMKCYYKDEAATAASLKDGWLYTGDMAREDEDGFIYLVDRKKDVIITGGENLYPVQIEDFLREMSEIKDVAVIGLPDERLGEIAAAIIEPKPDATLTEEMVEAYCLAMPRYKRPKRIIFDHVPRNPTGKIEKPALRRRYSADKLVEAETTR